MAFIEPPPIWKFQTHPTVCLHMFLCFEVCALCNVISWNCIKEQFQWVPITRLLIFFRLVSLPDNISVVEFWMQLDFSIDFIFVSLQYLQPQLFYGNFRSLGNTLRKRHSSNERETHKLKDRTRRKNKVGRKEGRDGGRKEVIILSIKW